MKTLLAGLAIAFGLSAPAVAGGHSDLKVVGTKVVISCYRGPMTKVIWDYPMPIFVDSLVRIGYDWPTAHAIATRVCRDWQGARDGETLKAETQRILQATPPRRKRH